MPSFAGRVQRLTDIPEGTQVVSVVVKATSKKNLLSRGKPVTVTLLDDKGHNYQSQRMAFYGKFHSSNDAHLKRVEDPAYRDRWLQILKMHPEVKAARQYGSKADLKAVMTRISERRFTDYEPDKYIFRDLDTGEMHYIDEGIIKAIMIGGTDVKEEIRKQTTRIATECMQQQGQDCADHALFAAALHRKENVEAPLEPSEFTRHVHGRALDEARNKDFRTRANEINYPDEFHRLSKAFDITFQQEQILDQLIRQNQGQGSSLKYLTVQQYFQLRGLRNNFGTEGYVTDDLREAQRALDRGSSVLISMAGGVAYKGTVTLGRPQGELPRMVNYVRSDRQGPATIKKAYDDGYFPIKQLTPEQIREGEFELHTVAGLESWKPAGNKRLWVVADSNNPAHEQEFDAHPMRFLDPEDIGNPPLPAIPPKPWSQRQKSDLYKQLVLGRTFFIILDP